MLVLVKERPVIVCDSLSSSVVTFVNFSHVDSLLILVIGTLKSVASNRYRLLPMNLSFGFGGAAGKSISNRPLDVIVSALNEPPTRLVSEIKLIYTGLGSVCTIFRS